MTIIWNNSPALPVLILLCAAISIPVLALLKRQMAYILAMAAAVSAVGFSALNVVKVLNHGPVHYHMGGWPPPIGIEYVLDYLSAFIVLVINSIAFLVLIHAQRVVRRELSSPAKEIPYYAVALLMMCGFNGIVVTGDFFNLYVWLEISSLSLYGLIAVGSKKSPVAALRYLIMGTIGACFYLLGLGFLFTVSGTLNMADMNKILPFISREPAVIIGLSLMVIGMGIKMALFPLHGWLPDSYTYAPSSSSALMAPIGTKVGAYVLIRILFFIFGVGYVSRKFPVTLILGWLSAAGIIFGSVMAIAQKEMKRMLAYSSVAQVGYIGMGIGLANPLGLIGAVLHVMNHGCMKALLFLVAGNFRTKLGHSTIPRFDDSLRKAMPWTTAAFTVGALSMVGIPPLVGFFSKWYLALGAIQKSNWIFLAVLLLSSLLNAVYFFRIIEKIYMKPVSRVPEGNALSAESKKTEVSAPLLIPTLILASALLLLGILNAYIVKGIIVKIIPAGM
ncbi:MAG: proton-conducting transporter membrane subunit [Candidatus Aminicenantales bacterium]